MTDRDIKPDDIRALAEATLVDAARDDLPPQTFRHKPHDIEVDLARFALAVFDALDEFPEERRGASMVYAPRRTAAEIRAAITRNMEARRGG